ncbi:MAG: hypothetical protein ACOH2T_19075 [Pseudomonas sp.]
MTRSNPELDAQLLAWMQKHRTDLTTAKANEFLSLQTSTQTRHVSRRFSQLVTEGILEADIKGTTRICKLVKKLPKNFDKAAPTKYVRTFKVAFSERAATAAKESKAKSIKATNSEEYLAQGGSIEVLPTQWANVAPTKSVLLDTYDHTE